MLAGREAAVQALVLEAVYPTIEEAEDNRVAMRVGPLSKVLTPFLLVQLRPRMGIGPEALRPIDHMKTLGCPVLVIAGTADRHTTEAQTRRLFAAAPEPKSLWLVPNAAHAICCSTTPLATATESSGSWIRTWSPRLGGQDRKR